MSDLCDHLIVYRKSLKSTPCDDFLSSFPLKFKLVFPGVTTVILDFSGMIVR
ncbi:MAG: hypothetical protein LBI20_00595 [Holosporales bacterium]|nr:hypothetical protein [Holosporales bacterium]